MIQPEKKETASERIDNFLRFKKKKWEEEKAAMLKKRRKMPKWYKNMPAECFLRIIRFFEFRFIFTDYATLNR